MNYYIEYKYDPCSMKVVLKPNTCYWRFRYWLNQYIAIITWFIIWPVVKLNIKCERLQKNEEITSLYEIHRMGLVLVSPSTKDKLTAHLIHTPWWIRMNKKLFKKSIMYWRESLSSPQEEN